MTQSLAGYVVNGVMLRWRYYDPAGTDTSQDWYAQIDDLKIDGRQAKLGEAPEPNTAGLLLGGAVLALLRRRASA